MIHGIKNAGAVWRTTSLRVFNKHNSLSAAAKSYRVGNFASTSCTVYQARQLSLAARSIQSVHHFSQSTMAYSPQKKGTPLSNSSVGGSRNFHASQNTASSIRDALNPVKFPRETSPTHISLSNRDLRHGSITEETVVVFATAEDVERGNLPFELPKAFLKGLDLTIAKNDRCYDFYCPPLADHVLLVTLGKEERVKEPTLVKALVAAIGHLRGRGISKAIFKLPELKAIDAERTLYWAGKTAILADYTFDKYLTKHTGEVKKPIDSIELVVTGDVKKLQQVLDQTRILAEQTVFTRDLANERADVATPEYFEQVARDLAQELGLGIEVLHEANLKDEGLNLIYGVGQGSPFPPRLVLLNYVGDKANPDNKIALVGKGITFDTGGLNIKPTNSIEDMHLDKGGASAVLGALRSAALQKLKVNIVAVLALAENAIDGNSMKPHEIIQSYKGITVEISNTDAEGRLVLADALTYVQRHYKPHTVLDIATLTGACVVALGEGTAGVFSNDDHLVEELQKAGKSSAEPVWRLPIIAEHRGRLKAKQADTRSTGKTRYGSSSIAAAFLEKFIEDGTKWAHIDIAGPSMTSKSVTYIPEGGTGFGAELLATFLKQQEKPTSN